VKGIDFMISFSAMSLLVYKNAIDFYILQLFNSFISSNSLLVKSSGFSVCSVISSVNRGRDSLQNRGKYLPIIHMTKA
jgi:hypothetical protein